ncbi:hypothetical protein E1B28_012064 [Marasmius oreades]|uniref:Uncharacterized protein n=1 Tax=Marasmius oreades TaxID=181124 RepID=A0A9P7RRB9_9AGAR|nr:uncharacterized protein E1B28_012064 [Marasmius oreades]KAG7088027.1 hypothetical protein E1B28_012064 [Marasmius oreades]
MVSLETLTTFQDKTIEYELFQLFTPWESRYIRPFEWIFGLDYCGFPFESELNIISVSKDIRQFLQKGTLVFIPNADVLEKACGVFDYNNTPSREPDERKRFEEFGTGPWEYTIIPGLWNRKTKKSESLPPLYDRSPNGVVVPFSFDDCDYDTLPRFTSAVHPLIVVLSLRMNPPDSHPTKSIQEKLILPLKRITWNWPDWEHNRFVPLPNTQFKREYNPGGQKLVCRCMFCSLGKPITENHSNSSGASSPELEDTCTDAADEMEELEEESRTEEYKELSRIANKRIAIWRGPLEGVAYVHDDVEHDGILAQYAQECTDAADKVMLRQEEERAKREILAAEL